MYITLAAHACWGLTHLESPKRVIRTAYSFSLWALAVSTSDSSSEQNCSSWFALVLNILPGWESWMHTCIHYVLYQHIYCMKRTAGEVFECKKMFLTVLFNCNMFFIANAFVERACATSVLRGGYFSNTCLRWNGKTYHFNFSRTPTRASITCCGNNTGMSIYIRRGANNSYSMWTITGTFYNKLHMAYMHCM